MPDKLLNFGQNGLLLTSTAQAAGTVLSNPVFTGTGYLSLPNGVRLAWPGATQNQDLAHLGVVASVTGQSGTSPTLNVTVESNANPFSDTTTTTAALTTVGTSATLLLRDGIAQNAFALLVSPSGDAAEWVQVTSAATTGAGVHTIVRARYGTVAKAFPSGSSLFFSNNWSAVPTNNATTTTLTTGAVSITGATATSPVVARIDSQALGMSGFVHPVFRISGTVAGTTPTATYRVSVTGRVR